MTANPNPQSLWAATAPPGPEAPALEEHLRTDVAVIGGGYTGLSAALHLAEDGRNVVVLESNDVGFGGSGRNVGLVNSGLWLSPEEIAQRLGAETGRRLGEALRDAPRLVFDLIARHGIDCEATHRGTLTLAHSARALGTLRQRAAQLKRLGVEVTILERKEAAQRTGTDRYHGALRDPAAGTVQPLGYARGLARAAVNAGARLYCGSPVRELRRAGGAWELQTPAGSVTADAVIQATNAYTDGLWPGLRESIIPVYFFQLASEPLGERGAEILPGAEGAADTKPVLASVRKDAAGRLIVGTLGNGDSSGVTILRRWAERFTGGLFPRLGRVRWEYAWTGRFAFTPLHVPAIHELAPGLITCIGYNGRGIGPGTVMGKALAEHLSGGEAALPLPPTPLRPLAAPGWRGGAYEAGIQSYHLGQLLRLMPL
ncbi:MAG: FAD-binding oxidoreductase [Ectothiorhodospiraceae bacterium]|jgi:glycine/D-amino acid oxidase-like deaminating enzyme